MGTDGGLKRQRGEREQEREKAGGKSGPKNQGKIWNMYLPERPGGVIRCFEAKGGGLHRGTNTKSYKRIYWGGALIAAV